MRIFLGDLVHDWEKVSVWTVPLNIGLVAAYAQKKFPDAEIRLFKYPNEMIKACREESPDIVGVSYYAWNTALDNVVLKAAKDANPNVLTVGGGPWFTVVNANQEGGEKFFKQQKYCDAFVVNQGEFGFVELLKAYLAADKDLEVLRRQTVPSVLINDLKGTGLVRVGPPIEDGVLDDVPSPYLTGLLEPFIENYIPLLETNRNCPYSCAFCAFGVGKGSKLLQFSLDRVMAEIEYISSRTKADYLITTDTNFGILPRDVEIAEKIHNAHLAYGFPGYLCVVWNKNRPDRVLETAKAFKGLAQVGASMQSLHPDVLKAIKRKNLALEEVDGIRKELQSAGTRLFSELIAALPAQTLQSHLDDNKRLMDLDAEVFNYVLRYLPGTEIDTKEMRDQYCRGTVWRLQDSAFGIYDGQLVFEGEEMAKATSTMSEEDVHAIRLIHFFFQVMWGKKYLFEYLKLFGHFGTHPADMVMAALDRFKSVTGPLSEVYRRFEADHALEKFETYEEMCAFWSQPANMERLRSGEHGKLNASYAFELLSIFPDFLAMLEELGNDVIDKSDLPDRELARRQMKAVLQFTEARLIHIDGINPIEDRKVLNFPFDICGWIAAEFDYSRLCVVRPEGYDVEFILTPQRLRGLEKQLKFFAHPNIRLTLRRIYDLNPYDFFYEARIPVAKN